MRGVEHLLLGSGPNGRANYGNAMMAQKTIDDYITHSESTDLVGGEQQ